jgi:hypothetical protein
VTASSPVDVLEQQRRRGDRAAGRREAHAGAQSNAPETGSSSPGAACAGTDPTSRRRSRCGKLELVSICTASAMLLRPREQPPQGQTQHRRPRTTRSKRPWLCRPFESMMQARSRRQPATATPAGQIRAKEPVTFHRTNDGSRPHVSGRGQRLASRRACRECRCFFSYPRQRRDFAVASGRSRAHLFHIRSMSLTSRARGQDKRFKSVRRCW